MSTSRTPARSHGTMAQAQSLRGSQDHAPPRRAKVAPTAQIDLSSIAFPTPSIRVGGSYGQHHQQQPQPQPQQQQPPNLPQSQNASRPSVKVRSSGPGATVSTLRPTTSSNSPSLRDAHRSVRFSNGPGLLSSNSSSGILRRIGAAGIGLGVGLNSGAAGTGARGGPVVAGSNTMPGVRDGSVTSSDDGTLSEDSVEDHIQLFSGAGGHLPLNGMPFTASTRQHGSVSGSSGGLPKMASPSATIANGSTRPGTSASTVSTTGQNTRPRRMAAGASINADMPAAIPIPALSLSVSSSTPATGVMGSGAESAAGSAVAFLSTSASSSTSSSSLSWVSSPSSASSSQRNSVNGASVQTSAAPSPRLGADETNTAAFRAPSPTPAGSNLGRQLQSQQAGTAAPSRPVATQSSGSQNPSQPIVRSRSVAPANKLAGESRRTEDAARTRRKIGDLEISNTSLLQINQTLEATVRKQAAEIQELKQRIQASSQFGNGFNLIPDTTTSQGKDISSEIIPENTPRSRSVITKETAVIILELTEAERQADLTFKRLCATIEQMMFEARQALDQSMRPAGVKVLSSYDMHEKNQMDDDDLDLTDQPIVHEDDADKSLDLNSPAIEDEDLDDLNDASTLGTDSTLS